MLSLPPIARYWSLIVLLSCSSNYNGTSNHNYPFAFEGVIQKSGFTIYMYGTHTILNNGKTFALQSKTINLDLYINQQVVVKGSKVEGYPVDDGPELINVSVVEKK